MGEFSGSYYRCNECGHIWDFNDICPNCGKDNQEDLNAHEVKQWSKACELDEYIRLTNMLEMHGDNK